MLESDDIAAGLIAQVSAFLGEHDPATTDRIEFLRARYAAGLAEVHYPAGDGGQGLPRGYQKLVNDAFERAGAPDNSPGLNVIGLGMAAPTILAFGTPEQRARFLPSLWTGEDIWCQLFSEPGAGSDLAGLAARAVRDGDEWIVNGQKVWTSVAHIARWGILLARTDPDLPKHQGLSFFICDMTAPGVEVRPLRQLTGDAEFNEVFFTDARIADADRLGAEGSGWAVARATLMNERMAIGGNVPPRESGMIGAVARTWREHPERHQPGLHDRLLQLWVDAEAARLASSRLQQKLAAGQPGPEGSAGKLVFARLAQELSALEVELLGDEGLVYDQWAPSELDAFDFIIRNPAFRYLRARGNSIEGGTSEVLRNVIAERVLGLPPEERPDTAVAWKDLPK
jgi:alkylation response protein AidB-like acyl-CoA dehydrogenase